MSKITSLYKKLAANQVVERAFHAAWQAGLAYVLASLAGTHGDLKGVATLGVATVLSAAKTVVIGALSGSTVAPPAA